MSKANELAKWLDRHDSPMGDQSAAMIRQQDALLRLALEALESALAVWLNEIDCEEYPQTEAEIRAAITAIKEALK